MSAVININLLPWREELKEHDKKQFLVMLCLFAGLAILIVSGVHVLFEQKISSQQELNLYLQNEIKVLDAQIAEIDKIQEEKERLLARMAIIQELQSNRPYVVHLFDNLARIIPDGLYLKSLIRQDKQVTLEGNAESNTRVSKFMRNIDSSKWLEKPVLSVIESDKKEASETDSLITFSLQAMTQSIGENTFELGSE